MSLDDKVTRKDEMINFIDEVNKTKRSNEAKDKFRNSVDYKLKLIKNEKDKARGICLDAIFSKIYKDALPLDNEYKISHGEDLDTEISDFIKSRHQDGMEYYVKEAIKRGSIPAKKIMESVDRMVKKAFFEAETNIVKVNPEDIKFDINSSDNQVELKKISDDMGLEEIADVIKTNVINTTTDEINKVKEEDEKLNELTTQLTQNPEITTESAIQRELRKHGIGQKQIYSPSLFTGIMIGKTNYIKESMNDIDDERCNKLAFLESVKEYTKWSVVKALKLEDITPSKTKLIASRYARGVY